MRIGSRLRSATLLLSVAQSWGQVQIAIQPVSTKAADVDQEAVRALTGRLQDLLEQQILRLPNLVLVDRKHAAALLREQNILWSESVDRSAAEKIGRMMRVDAMMLISLYPLKSSGLFSTLTNAKHWTASADVVEVATGRVVAKPVCGEVGGENQITACAQQIAQEMKPAIQALLSSKQQRAKAENEANIGVAAARQAQAEAERASAQQRTQALRLEEARSAEALQRERTQEERLRLQRIEEEQAEQQARERLNAELERAKARLSDLAVEATAMLDYWGRIQAQLRQEGGALRPTIRTAVSRLRADMDGAEECLKRGQLNDVVSYLGKARADIDALERMK
jgi:hypothetical protein